MLMIIMKIETPVGPFNTKEYNYKLIGKEQKLLLSISI